MIEMTARGVVEQGRKAVEAYSIKAETAGEMEVDEGEDGMKGFEGGKRDGLSVVR